MAIAAQFMESRLDAEQQRIIRAAMAVDTGKHTGLIDIVVMAELAGDIDMLLMWEIERQRIFPGHRHAVREGRD
jgi:hypothetical protein